MSDIEVRSAAKADAEAILDLWVHSEARPTKTDSIEALHTLIERDDEALIVAILNDRLVGTLIAAWDGWRGNMYRLAVHPAYRRRRVASRLVTEGERRLRDKGCKRITALVVGIDEPAVRLWTEVGYERQKEMLRFRRNLEEPLSAEDPVREA